MKNNILHVSTITVFPVCIFLSSISYAEPVTTSYGIRGNLELADGTPANDILGYGIYFSRSLNRNWNIGLAVDNFDYDLENPAKLIGISSNAPDIIDAAASSTMLSIWGERYLRSYLGRGDLIISLGIGINSIEVEDVTGPLSGGGMWRVQTDIDTDYVLLAGLAVKYPLARSWLFNAGIGSNYHFGEWRLQDVSSGATHSIDGFYSWSIRLGVSREFK